MDDIFSIAKSYNDIWTSDVVSNLNEIIKNSRKREIKEEIKLIKKTIEHICENPKKYYGSVQENLNGYRVTFGYKNTYDNELLKGNYITFTKISRFFLSDGQIIADYFNKFDNIKFTYSYIDGFYKMYGKIKLSENIEL